MSRVNYTVEQIKKLGLVQVNGGAYVPVKSLVAKDKVKKLPDIHEIWNNAEITKIEKLENRPTTLTLTPLHAKTEDIDFITVQLPNLLEQKEADEKFEPIDFYEKYKDMKLSNYTTVYIKPLTQNRAWAGRRVKSHQYKAYEVAVSLLLPKDLIVPEGLLKVYYEFGMSRNSDFDNPCKMFTDILQAKYNFNDSRIMEANIRKVIVKKDEEYISFKIEKI